MNNYIAAAIERLRSLLPAEAPPTPALDPRDAAVTHDTIRRRTAHIERGGAPRAAASKYFQAIGETEPAPAEIASSTALMIRRRAR